MPVPPPPVAVHPVAQQHIDQSYNASDGTAVDCLFAKAKFQAGETVLLCRPIRVTEGFTSRVATILRVDIPAGDAVRDCRRAI